ncbi:hypothetical protein ACA910_015900 [Epithemia clementina (nom. ined.)]
MPPVLDPKHSRVDGLAFLGLSLTRKSKTGHPDSATHQQAFDLDLVQDRDYEYVFSTNDDGWLVGGGEPGPPYSYKLASKDSAHVEIMRIGTYCEEWGGLPQELIVESLRNGDILIPEITVVPTAVVANGDHPPELEIRFDMVPAVPNFHDDTLSAPLPLNWQLRFLQNQLFHKFQFASRFTPGAFHSTILRKAEFRSEQARAAYFAKCRNICEQWMERGTQPLAPTRNGVSSNIEVVRCVRREPKAATTTTLTEIDETKESRLDGSPDDDLDLQDYYRSGLWLFTDRNNITHQFLPNFLPPYDTPIKKKLILEVLKEEWDEKTLSWKKLTTRFDGISSFLPSGLVDNGRRTVSPKMVAIPPPSSPPPSHVASRGSTTTPTTPKSPSQYPNLGILDPSDDDGFTHFVTCLGTEMANMTAEVCRPMMMMQQQAHNSNNNTDADDEVVMVPANDSLLLLGEDPDGGMASSRGSPHRSNGRSHSGSPKVKAVVSGRRVSKNHRRDGVE